MEWVRVDERMPVGLPPEGKHSLSVEVIVTDGVLVGTCECMSGNLPKPWIAFSSYGDVKGTDITHWMPLPESPAE